MDLLSISKIFGGISSPVRLFRCIFDEYAIPQLNAFYDLWNSDNALDSLSRSIRRMTVSVPKSYTQKYRMLAEILTQTDAFLHLNSHIDSFITEYKGADLLDILCNVTSEIRLELADDSIFSTTLSLLWNNVEKPYAKARLLSWCIVYLIFKQYHIQFQNLYDITNTDSYRELYCDIISGEELLRNHYIYQRNSVKFCKIPMEAFPAHHENESHSTHKEPEQNADTSDRFFGKAASSLAVNKNFIGRKKELSMIESSLGQCNKMLIQGMGGIGKSVLVKAYAYQHREQYHTILFLSYEHDLCETLVNEQQLKIKGICRYYAADGKMESNEDYFRRKLELLQSLLDENALLILDNFDTEYDPHLEAFLSGSYAVLITTRNDFSHLGLSVLTVSEMLRETEQLQLFQNYYKKATSYQDKEMITRILSMLDGHTYAIELIAKLMFRRRIAPQKMIEILDKNGISPELKGTIPHGFEQETNVYDNIRRLFLIDKLSPQELTILCCLTLIPISGFDFEEFAGLCGLGDCEVLTKLCTRSWVRYDETNDLISLHPLIADVVACEYGITIENCEVFLQHFCDKISDSYNLLYSDKLRYTEIALKICRRIPLEVPAAYQLYRYIAVLLTRMEFFELSSELLNCCLDFSCKTYGKHSKETAEAYYNLCDCPLYNSDYASSLKYIQKSIDIMYHVNDASAELAYYLKFKLWCMIDTADMGDDMTEIFTALTECNMLMKDIYPEDHPQTASLDTLYAYAYCYSGQYKKALEYADRAYHSFFRLYGDIHSDTIAPLGIKSLILSAMQRIDEAVSLCLHVIEIQKLFWGEDHLKVLKRFETLAKIYQNGNMLTEAKNCLYYVCSVLEEKNAVTNDFYPRVVHRLKQIED